MSEESSKKENATVPVTFRVNPKEAAALDRVVKQAGGNASRRSVLVQAIRFMDSSDSPEGNKSFVDLPDLSLKEDIRLLNQLIRLFRDRQERMKYVEVSYHKFFYRACYALAEQNFITDSYLRTKILPEDRENAYIEFQSCSEEVLRKYVSKASKNLCGEDLDFGVAFEGHLGISVEEATRDVMPEKTN